MIKLKNCRLLTSEVLFSLYFLSCGLLFLCVNIQIFHSDAKELIFKIALFVNFENRQNAVGEFLIVFLV